MGWYDLFARVYDGSVEQVYRPYRRAAVDALELGPGEVVLDLACGTGPNLAHLMAAGPEAVIALDHSAGMLARAQRRASSQGWTGVHTVQADAREVDHDALAAALGRGALRLDAVICCLGLSVIPEWEAVLCTIYGLIRPGGRFVVFDVHTRGWVPMTSFVRLVAQADTSRRPWEALEALGASVEHRWLPGSPHIHGGTPFQLVARKPG